jgi:hypothetical protein
MESGYGQVPENPEDETYFSAHLEVRGTCPGVRFLFASSVLSRQERLAFSRRFRKKKAEFLLPTRRARVFLPTKKLGLPLPVSSDTCLLSCVALHSSWAVVAPPRGVAYGQNYAN